MKKLIYSDKQILSIFMKIKRALKTSNMIELKFIRERTTKMKYIMHFENAVFSGS